MKDFSKRLIGVLSFLLQITESDSVSFTYIPDRRELQASGKESSGSSGMTGVCLKFVTDTR